MVDLGVHRAGVQRGGAGARPGGGNGAVLAGMRRVLSQDMSPAERFKYPQLVY
jgi:hypothetical protein